MPIPLSPPLQTHALRDEFEWEMRGLTNRDLSRTSLLSSST